jgi:hypothetical protein
VKVWNCIGVELYGDRIVRWCRIVWGLNCFIAKQPLLQNYRYINYKTISISRLLLMQNLFFGKTTLIIKLL